MGGSGHPHRIAAQAKRFAGRQPPGRSPLPCGEGDFPLPEPLRGAIVAQNRQGSAPTDRVQRFERIEFGSTFAKALLELSAADFGFFE
jgi:hypothetical protein